MLLRGVFIMTMDITVFITTGTGFLIATLIAYAAAVGDDDVHAEATLLKSDVRPDGFDIALETTNHIHQVASGDEHGNIHGDFEWVSPEGEHVAVKYVADENGYQPSSKHAAVKYMADENGYQPISDILIAALIAFAAADSDDAHAEVTNLKSDVRADGFDSVLDTSNHIHQAASGDEHGNIHGDFEWVSPEGQHVAVKYVADENGYQPSGDLIPQRKNIIKIKVSCNYFHFCKPRVTVTALKYSCNVQSSFKTSYYLFRARQCNININGNIGIGLVM
ncbi:Larval cuticle protein 2 [Lucilia cuprina]|uniref:Larval cuticle protein 2 n=1 Tax=Lucilia cuprina TaxID=7375 RepID=A0A0L0CMX8_LUCCU|nr:Larval cuticle protein 2 [Lucilia cuprina]